MASAANGRTTIGAFSRGGTSVAPSLSDCSTDGGTSCVAVAVFKAADMTNVVPTKIKSGVTIAAVAGDYPSGAYPLAGADGTADLDLATFDAKIKAATNFEWFDSPGSRYVNAGDADILDTNIITTVNIFLARRERWRFGVLPMLGIFALVRRSMAPRDCSRRRAATVLIPRSMMLVLSRTRLPTTRRIFLR